MIEESFVKLLSELGALGVLAVFAGILLRFTLKQQERLASLLNNHLTSLLNRQDITNKILENILEATKDQRAHFEKHEEHMDRQLDKLRER